MSGQEKADKAVHTQFGYDSLYSYNGENYAHNIVLRKHDAVVLCAENEEEADFAREYIRVVKAPSNQYQWVLQCLRCNTEFAGNKTQCRYSVNRHITSCLDCSNNSESCSCGVTIDLCKNLVEYNNHVRRCKWNERIEDLREFVDKNPDATHIPQHTNVLKNLYKFVQKQTGRSGNTAIMTEEMKETLRSLVKQFDGRVNGWATENSKYECPYPNCSCEYKKRRDLTAHIRQTHMKNGKYPCEYPNCSCVRSNWDELNRHMKKEHK